MAARELAAAQAAVQAAVQEQRRAGAPPLRQPLHRRRSSERVPEQALAQVAVRAWELVPAQQQVQLPAVLALTPPRPELLALAPP
jgi:hypothetical protein|tara:strand:+ start:170 stop:424 length:255 start_codon:yes stop_codon:yes gene_type:complete